MHAKAYICSRVGSNYLCIRLTMDRATKLRRLNTFRRHLPHVTAAALAAILIAVRKDGLPDLNDRGALREARDLQSNANTPYGPIIQSLKLIADDGGSKQMLYAHPFALLWTAVKDSAGFSKFFKEQLLKKPPSVDEPWRLILYSDEVTPGNPLSTANRRKFHAIYWSFLEFGMHALCHEEAWFCSVTEHSTVLSTVSAGLSQAFAAILKTFFDPKGFNLQLSGINLPFDTGDIRLWAKLGIVVQDGGAHKSVWGSRGDGATKYCLLCTNLFTSESRICDHDGKNLLVSNIIKLGELVAATDAQIKNNARYIESQAGKMSKAEFILLQQSLGITHHPHALLLDRSLDPFLQPTKAYMHDWMHALFVDGVVNLVVYMVFEEFVSQRQNVYEAFANYAAKWRWPGRVHGSHLADIFEASRKDKHRKAEAIKCQASDLLSLMCVLALFVQTVLLPLNIANDACHVFLALADLVDLIIATPRTDVRPEVLLGRVHRFLHLYVNCFGYDAMIPKFHWLLHLPECLVRFGVLLNCFALERKHRTAKRYATELTNTSRNPTASLLSEVMCHQLAMLDRPGAFAFDPGLVGGRKAPAKIKALIVKALHADEDACAGFVVQVARESRFNCYGTCVLNDVVLFKESETFRAGRVEVHCDVEGIALSIVTPFSLVKHDAGKSYAVWQPSESAEIIETDRILDTVVHTVLPSGKVGTILPADYK